MMIAAALALPIMALAADYPWLTFRMADDTQFSVPAESLSMNYSDGNLHLTSMTVDKTIPVDQIKSMQFTSEASGVNEVNENQTKAGEYYNLAGTRVGRFATIDEARKSLPSGVYIVKNELKTFKVAL